MNTDNDEIQWGDPPPKGSSESRQGQGRTQRFVERLQSRPGEWAKYPVSLSAQSSASAYRANYPGTEWATRLNDEGRRDLYARWIGADA